MRASFDLKASVVSPVRATTASTTAPSLTSASAVVLALVLAYLLLLPVGALRRRGSTA